MERLLVVLLLFPGGVILGRSSAILRRYTFVNGPKNWADARKHCREKFNDLATISDYEEVNQTIAMNTPGTAWIGLYRKNASEPFRWPDGNNFTNWNVKEPGTDEKCVEMLSNGLWNDKGCHHEQPFVCHEVAPMILINERKTWDEAVEHCREEHHDLVSAQSEDMREWVKYIAEIKATTPFVWIGLRYTCVLEFWFWVDSEPYIEDNWTQGNWTQGMEADCGRSGAMTNTSTMWFSQPNTEKLNFICSLC